MVTAQKPALDLRVATAQKPALDPRVIITLLLIVALAAFLRFTNLADNPRWDADEGYNINIAANLAAGRVQMFGLQFAFVQHPPLFFILGALAFHLAGTTILTLRAVAAAAAVVTVPVMFVIGRTIGYPLSRPMSRRSATGRRRGFQSADTLGLLCAVVFAIAPPIVTQTRFAYTYNLLMLLTALFLAGGLAILNQTTPSLRRILPFCGICAGLGLATDQEAVFLFVPLLVALLRPTTWRTRWLTCTLCLLPPAIYIVAMLLNRPTAFLFDVTHTATRVSSGSWGLQLYSLAYNFTDLLRFDPWVPLGLAGLLLIPAWRQRGWALLLAGLLLLVVLKVRDPNPTFRAAEPLWPFIAAGSGLVVFYAAHQIMRTFTQLAVSFSAGTEFTRQAAIVRKAGILVSRLAVVVVLGVPLFVTTVVDLHDVSHRLATPIDSGLPQSIANAHSLARWVNAHSQSTDLILAMPHISWLFHARTAELLQAVAITGQASDFYPAGLNQTRFVYDVHPKAARYLVIDYFTRRWINEDRLGRAIVVNAQRHWTRVFQLGEYIVYENPERPHPG